MTSTTKGIVAASLMAAAALVAAPANAAPIFDTGSPNHLTAYTFTSGFKVAEDFNVATASSLTGATFYVLAPVQMTNLTYFIYAAGASGPGAQLATGSAQGLSSTATGGTYFGLPESLVSFSFASAFAASAGTTYWLGLASVSSDALYWESAANNATSLAYQSNGGPYGMVGTQLAFTIVGSSATAAVPEPATWGMLLAGFGAVGGALRRRQRVTSCVSFG